MQELIRTTQNDINHKAFALVDGHQLFSSEDLQFLHHACKQVPKELIQIGDVGERNHLDVSRFMEDRKDETPVYRNDPLGKDVVNRLNKGRCRELLSVLMEGEYFIRRC